MKERSLPRHRASRHKSPVGAAGASGDAPSPKPTNSKWNLFHLLSAQLVSFVSGIALLGITAHFMGPSARGELAYIMSIANLVGFIGYGSVQIGMEHANLRGLATRRPAVRALTLSSVLLLAVGTILAGVLALARAGGLQITLLAALGAALTCQNFGTLRVGQVLGLDRAFRNSWLIQAGGLGVLGSLTAWSTRSPAMVVLAWCACLAASTAYMHRSIQWDEPGLDRAVGLRRLIRDSWSGHLAVVGSQVLYRLPVVALGLFATKEAVGYYSVAAPVAEISWLVSEAFSLLAFRSATRGRAGLSAKYLVAHWAATLVMGLCIGAAGWFVLPLVLPEFKPSSWLILILLPGVLVQGGARLAMQGILARRSGRLPVVMGVTTAAASLVYFPAAAWGGATAVAITAVILYLLHGGLVLFLERRVIRQAGTPTPE